MARYDRVIPPGGEGQIDAVVETDKYQGSIAKGLKVRTNDPVNPVVSLQIKATVRSWIDVVPNWNAVFQVELGKGGEHELFLRVKDPETKVDIIGALSDNQHVDPKIQKLRGDDPNSAQGDYRVLLAIDPAAPIGPITGKITISTTLQQQRRIRIPIAGKVLGPINFFPARLVMFADQSGRPARLGGTIVLQSRPGVAPFELVSYEADDDRVQIEPLSEGATTIHRVGVTWTAPADKGIHDGIVRLRTDHATMPEIRIAYQVRIE